MADTIVGGLFGVNPQQLAQQRQATDTSRAFQFANLGPAEQAQYGAYLGGSQLGRAATGLMGGDAEMQKVTAIKQLSSQFDLTSPTGMREFAQALQPIAPNEAMMAAKRADEIEGSAITRGLNLRKTETEGNQLAWVGVDGQPDMKQQAVVDKATGAIIRRVGDPISVVTSRATSTVNLPAGESEFVKQLGKNDAQTVTKAMETRDTAISTLQSLAKLESLNNQQLISGTFATGRVGAANFLNTIGLASSADVSRISSSQQYDKVAKDVIFQTLGGKLGAGFSNEDRKFIEALIPQLETSADARRKLIEYMRGKQQLIADESTRLENYARSNRGLGGFEYKIPRETLAPTGSANKPEYTLEQLKAALAKKEKESK
jgi:hypothetical protein